MKKKKVLLLIATGVLAISTVTVLAAKTLPYSSFAELVCSHEGNHYEAVDATCSKAGSKEFWACCKCHEQFLEQPAGEWADQGPYSGEELLDTHLAYVAPNPNNHATFGYNGLCSGCSKTMKEVYSLEDGNLKTVTLNEITGFTDPLNVKDLDASSHFFGDYNIGAKGGLEFAFNLQYTGAVEGTGTVFYFGNAVDESGLAMFIRTNRADKYTFINFGTTLDVPGNTLVKNPSEGSPDFYYAPNNELRLLTKTTSNPGDDGKLIKIKFDLVDKATETYHFSLKLSTDGGATWAANWANQTEGGNAWTGFDFSFGAGYFDTHQKIRVSNQGSSSCVLTNAKFAAANISYENDSGTVFGQKTFTVGSQIQVPTISREGYKFVGWYDQKGTEFKDGELAVAGEYRLVARFIEKQTYGFTLSDLVNNSGAQLFDTKGKWLESTSIPAGDAATGNLTMDISKATRLDLFLKFDQDCQTGDRWTNILAFPYDYVNGKSRISWRFNAVSTDATVAGYIYNGSPNNDASPKQAGQDGTHFSATSIANDGPYLLHISVTDKAAASQCAVELEIVRLADGATQTIARDIEFGSNPNTVNYSTANANLNHVRLFSGDSNVSYRVSDAF